MVRCARLSSSSAVSIVSTTPRGRCGRRIQLVVRPVVANTVGRQREMHAIAGGTDLMIVLTRRRVGRRRHRRDMSVRRFSPPVHFFLPPALLCCLTPVAAAPQRTSSATTSHTSQFTLPKFPLLASFSARYLAVVLRVVPLDECTTQCGGLQHGDTSQSIVAADALNELVVVAVTGTDSVSATHVLHACLASLLSLH